jgi:hypothetical protein
VFAVETVVKIVTSRLCLFLFVLLLTLAVGVLPAQAATRLVAKAGPGTSISLRTASGKSVTRLASGTYVILVKDRSRVQNFDLLGPVAKSSRKTSLRFLGAVTWRLTLVPGRYSYYSDAHPTFRSTFRVV